MEGLASSLGTGSIRLMQTEQHVLIGVMMSREFRDLDTFFFFLVFVSFFKGIQSRPLRDGKRDGEVGILKRQCIRIVG